MRRTLRPFLPLLLFTSLFAAEKKVTSTVVAVTVYNDRALVTRTFSERLGAGTHTLIIPNLPVSLVDNSLRVGGTSEVRARVLDVQVQSVFLDTIPEERIQSLTRQLQDLRDQKVDLGNRLAVVRARGETLDSLVLSYSRAFGAAPPARSPLDEWDRLLQFETRMRTEQTKQITSLERELRTLDGKIRVVEQTLRAQTSNVRKAVKQVKIAVEVRTEGEISGEVSYVVTDASWTPSYEMRFRSGDSVSTMTFSGEVRQSTGEDWKQIQMTLSTAMPSRGAEIPPVTPWLVESFVPGARQRYGGGAPMTRGGRYVIDQSGPANMLRGRIIDTESGEPLIGGNVVLEGTSFGAASNVNGMYLMSGIPSGTYTVRSSYIGYAPVTMTNVQITAQGSSLMDISMHSTAVQASEVVISAERPLIQRNTTNTVRVAQPNAKDEGSAWVGRPQSPEVVPISVGLGEAQQDISSTSFRIGVPSDVPADNVGHKVSIAVRDMATTFDYVAIPRVSPYVYLTAAAINGAPYPLVGGQATIFTDGSYVSTTQLVPTLSRDTVTINVGVDESVRASRTLVHRFVEDVGTFSKSTRITFEVLLTVQSSRPRSTVVEVREALPYSSDERITVRYLEPTDLKDRLDKSGVLRWKPSVRTDSTATLTLRFSIEYPKDKFFPAQE